MFWRLLLTECAVDQFVGHIKVSPGRAHFPGEPLVLNRPGLAAAVTGLIVAALFRVGALDCPGIVPLVEDGIIVGQTIYDCVEPTASWWGLLLGSATGAAVALVGILGLRPQTMQRSNADKGV